MMWDGLESMLQAAPMAVCVTFGGRNTFASVIEVRVQLFM